MPDDYVWDGSGEPDPEVERLEKILGRLRWERPAPRWPARVIRFPRPVLAIAAGVAMTAAAAWVLTRPAQNTWQVARLQGAPVIGEQRLRGAGRLAVGEWLQTDAGSRAQLQVGQIGHVEIEPNTLLRLVEARWTNHRLALKRGEIHARIYAPPRLFFVETPSATAVDLGCAYDLKVDEAGASMLRVTHGFVSFEWGGRESLVPAGAACVTRPGVGPGTPYYQDASGEFREALARLDFDNGGEPELGVILRESRRRDVLSLWHLLGRTGANDRGRLFDRMAGLVEIPDGVTREAVVALDKEVLRLWWEELGLEESGWWR